MANQPGPSSRPRLGAGDPSRRPAVLVTAAALGLLALASCAPERKDAPLRSPSQDYPHPPVRTSDGKVVGADGKPPSDWIAEHGTTGHAAPGWKAGPEGPSYDPTRHAGAPMPSASAPPRCASAAPASGFPRLERKGEGDAAACAEPGGAPTR
jgi:hypothetical protein